MTRRRLPPEERREEIIAAATDIFSRGGYAGSNLREIAASAGISLTGLLYHFPTKEALLLAVLEAQDQERVRANARPIDEASLAEEITGIVRARIGDPGLLRLWAILDAEAIDPAHPLHGRSVELYRLLTGALAANLQPRVDAGQLDGDLDVHLAASVLLTFLHGLYSRAALDPTLDVEELLSGFLRMSPWITGSPVT